MRFWVFSLANVVSNELTQTVSLKWVSWLYCGQFVAVSVNRLLNFEPSFLQKASTSNFTHSNPSMSFKEQTNGRCNNNLEMFHKHQFAGNAGEIDCLCPMNIFVCGGIYCQSKTLFPCHTESWRSSSPVYSTGLHITLCTCIYTKTFLYLHRACTVMLISPRRVLQLLDQMRWHICSCWSGAAILTVTCLQIFHFSQLQFASQQWTELIRVEWLLWCWPTARHRICPTYFDKYVAAGKLSNMQLQEFEPLTYPGEFVSLYLWKQSTCCLSSYSVAVYKPVHIMYLADLTRLGFLRRTCILSDIFSKFEMIMRQITQSFIIYWCEFSHDHDENVHNKANKTSLKIQL